MLYFGTKGPVTTANYTPCYFTKRRHVKIRDIKNVVYIEGLIVSERMSSYSPAAKGLEVFGMLNSIAIVLRLHQSGRRNCELVDELIG